MALADTPNTAEDKLAAVEKTLYGATQTGALATRIQKIEAEYTGVDTKLAMMKRVDYLYSYTFDSGREPSLISRMNALEWAICHKISSDQPMVDRINNMENTINGHTTTSTIHERMDNLASFAFGTTHIPLSEVAVPANTLVKVALTTPINAKNVKAGDVIRFESAEDVVEDGMLLVAKGAAGEGKILKVSQAGNFGRDAKIEAEFNTMTAVDGKTVDMILGQEAKDKMDHLAMAAGASIAGMVLLGPIGIIGGAFVYGKNIDLPVGTEFYIQTKNDTSIFAIPTTTE